jgi:hypothetical protein
MSKPTNDVPIKAILSLIAQGDEDDKLIRELETIIDKLSVKDDTVYILTKLGTEIIIKNVYGDYNLYIHPLIAYETEDTPFKLYSLDRVKHYLNLIYTQEKE